MGAGLATAFAPRHPPSAFIHGFSAALRSSLARPEAAQSSYKTIVDKH
jgi:hypothetical protein